MSFYLRSKAGTLITCGFTNASFVGGTLRPIEEIDKISRIRFSIQIDEDRFDCEADVIAYGQESVLVVTRDITGEALDLDVPHANIH